MSKQRRKSKEERKAAQRAGARQPAARATPAAAKPVTPTTTRKPAKTYDRPLTFGKDTYVWMGVGFALVVLGLLLMSGGRGDDPTVFDESVIYSFRKVTLAPLVMLAGLGTVIYAILKK